MVAGTLVASLFVAMGMVRAHSGDAVDAEWAAVVPTIDGAMSPGEWADAAMVDLGAIPGNYLQAFMLVKNDASYLWFAYDATGDVTNSSDAASFAVDSGHDGTASHGAEDQFVLSSNLSLHLVYDASYGDWLTEDAPFDPSLPDHAGLAGAMGFGTSDLSGTPHRTYEFQIPLVLIGAASGDTVGLFGGSEPAPGVVDYDGYVYSTWPDFVLGPIPLGQYGDLNLAVPPGPVGVSITPSSASRLGGPGDTVDYSLLVRNRGTAGADTFDLTSLSTWTVGLWDAAGVNPLADTDGDAVPDTGNLASGASTAIVVRVDIPPSASGCDVATITATSSVDTSVWDPSTLTTCTGPASFAPPHSDFGVDSDGDFLYNYLEVDVVVSVSTSGYYYVVGDLRNGDGSVLIDQDYWSFYASPGTSVVPLSFDGRRISSAGIDGPYRVELSLIDEFYQFLDDDVHTTGPYAVADFDPPPARFSPPHADVGVDDDTPPNGMFDRLLLRASLQVDQGGYYWIAAEVYDASGSSVTYGWNASFLPAGSQGMEIAFAGIYFYSAAADGPYRIEMYLFDDFGNFLDNDTHVTGPYLHTDFDPPPISFAPPHADRGEDADVPPDGLYDFLVVSASVSVGEVGDFQVSGYLYGPGGYPLDGEDVVVSLTPGPATVDLRFSGPAIQRAGLSGNFEVYLYARKVGDFNATDYDEHTTGYYDFRSFQPPPALFSPPHGDRTVDTSVPPDGFDDYLVIDASVDVTKAGPFTVEAYVYDYYGRFVSRAFGGADLGVGSGSIPVRIDGHRISETLPPMPLYAYLELYDGNDNELDFDTHLTGVYDPFGFQPPDVGTPSSSARISGGYLRSVAPLRVDFTATDGAPSDGIASIALYYRYSPNNASWFPWTLYSTQAGTAGHSQVTGTFLFDVPDGDGYYEFYTVAADYGGNEEPATATPEAAVAVFVPRRVELASASASMSAGGTVDVSAQAVSETGDPVTLEAPLRVSLLTTSAAGIFRDAGGDPVTEVVIPAGASEVLLRYTDTRAGDATLSAFASGLEFGSATISVVPGPPDELALSPPSAGIPVASTITFTATVRDAYGNVVANAPLSWSVQGNVGTVTSGGVFTAGTVVGPGSISVESSGLTANAPIVLSPGPPDRVRVLATTYNLATDGTATARAFAFDEYGNIIPDTSFAWSIQGPGRLSDTTGDEVTVLATGSGTIRVTATAGSLEETIELVAASEGLAPVAPVGVGGAIVGLVVGFGIGWFLSRRRRTPPVEGSTPPPSEESKPPT